MYSPSIQKLIDLFAKFPTVGPRTAQRFVFYLLGLPQDKIQELSKAIGELKNHVKICPSCFKPFESNDELCEICSDGRRDKSLICLVESEADLEAIEKIKVFKGLYFILGGPSSPKNTQNKEELKKRLEQLVKRIKNSQSIKEIIIALNPTTDGENMALWLERKFKDFIPKMSRLARGLPKGGELEYADDETLSSAFENRK